MIKINETVKNSPLAYKTYVVGGALRDYNLDQPINDVDYVITASQEEFQKYFPDAQMVGTSFPVYLIEGEEVALSRTERSNGNGYGNFELTGVGVSIEEDLQRRDFTINAIAMNILTGEIIDPFNGLEDLKQGIIRTTYEDSFKDDPVRILRAARFASRFNFQIEFNTFNQATQHQGELEHVTKERIVLELSKVWKQANEPSSYFRELLRQEIIDRIIPGFSKLDQIPAGPVEYHGNDTAFEHVMQTIDRAKELDAPFHVFIAMLFHDFGKAFTDAKLLPAHHNHENVSADLAEEFLANHKFTKRVKEFVPKAAKLHMKGHRVTDMQPRKLVKFAVEIGTRDFADMKTVVECDHPLNKEENFVFDKMEEMLYNTDFSELQNVAPKARKDKAHQIRVSNLKRLLKGAKE